jgi:2-dehydro-3-deoxygluconokinase
VITNDIRAKGAGDKIYAAFGEIMLRLSAPGFERLLQSPVFSATFGGGEANVLVSLACLGLGTRYITALPDNDIARAARRRLRGFGVDLDYAVTVPGSRMGIYYLERGANQRPSRVIYDRIPSAVADIGADAVDWEKALAGCGWFHVTGITPALSEKAADATEAAVSAARKMGLVVSIDLNFRAKLWKWGKSAPEVMGKLAGSADVIVANEEDCQKSLGIGTDRDYGKEVDKAYYEGLAADVLSRYSNLKLIAITLRQSVSASHNRWGAMAADRTQALFSRNYDITHVVDRVGGGDAFAAGLIYGLSRLPSLGEALEFAAAASCLAHSIEGDWNLSTLEEIHALAAGEASGRIKR